MSNTRAGMYEHRHRAPHTENSTLRAELHEMRTDLDLREQELRRSALKVGELESELNSAPSLNPSWGDFAGRIRELTN